MQQALNVILVCAALGAVVLCVGLLVRRLLGSNGGESGPAEHSARAAPRLTTAPSADRLREIELYVRRRALPGDRYATVRDLYDSGQVNEAEVRYLLECD